jgi:hypothetical protein
VLNRLIKFCVRLSTATANCNVPSSALWFPAYCPVGHFIASSYSGVAFLLQVRLWLSIYSILLGAHKLFCAYCSSFWMSISKSVFRRSVDLMALVSSLATSMLPFRCLFALLPLSGSYRVFGVVRIEGFDLDSRLRNRSLAGIGYHGFLTTCYCKRVRGYVLVRVDSSPSF